MTKLYTDELVKYFQEVRKKLLNRYKYDDYIFPEELTAEFMADKFDVTRETVIRKLKQLESDNYLVSKKGNVVGKPGKRLVFFLKEDITFGSYGSGEMPEGIPARYLLCENKIWKAEIEENGDALLTLDLIYKNISKKNIIEIPMPQVGFDTYDRTDVMDRMVKIIVNGKDITKSAKALKSVKKFKYGEMIETVKKIKSQHYSRVIYVVQLEKPMKPEEVTHISFGTLLPHAYTNMFDIEYHNLSVHEPLMKTTVKIVAPKGYSINNQKKYKNNIFKRGIIIKNMSSGFRNEELEKKVPSPKVMKRSIQWKMDRPPIGYRYQIPFKIIK